MLVFYPGLHMSQNDDDSLRHFLLELYRIGTIKFGQYKLKSELISPVYIDIRLIFGYPEMMKKLAELVWKEAKSIEFDLIAGVPYTALPIATIVSTMCSKPFVVIRKEQKNYGTGKLVDGVYSRGQSCIIIEDVITSGSSIIEASDKLKNAGLVVKAAIVLINRNQGALKNLLNSGIEVHCITDLPFFVSTLKQHGYLNEQVENAVLDYINTHSLEKVKINSNLESCPADTWSYRAGTTKSALNKILFKIIESKKSNICFSADVTTKAQVLSLTDLVGPEICILKIHIDIIEDFDFDLIDQLKVLSKKHNFLIFEDRKFADIGNTVELQYTRGIYRISEWANMITSHINAGLNAIQSLIHCIENQATIPDSGPRSIVLLSQMSTQDNLMNKNFVENAISIAQMHPEFISGFVCQERICEDSGFVYFTPGVSLESIGDGKGQNYNTPETAIIDKKSDVIILGRGIYSSSDPRSAARKYRERSWNAYIQRISK